MNNSRSRYWFGVTPKSLVHFVLCTVCISGLEKGGVYLSLVAEGHVREFVELGARVLVWGVGFMVEGSGFKV